MLPALLALLLTADGGVLLARPVQVSADKLEVQNKAQSAEYTGHAKVIRDATTVTCDRLIVEYGANRDVTFIRARGNVEATEGDKWAHGEEADYDNRTGVLVMRGNPRAKQGQREVIGEQVTFVTGGERITVTKARTRVETAGDGGVPERIAIDADLLVLDEQQSRATWTGHVKARKANTLLLAPELIASYDKAGVITRVEGHKGIEAFEGDRWATGQHADYDVASGVLIVTGKPEAKQGRNHMKGTRVKLVTGTEIVEVENVVSVMEVDKKPGPKPKK